VHTGQSLYTQKIKGGGNKRQKREGQSKDDCPRRQLLTIQGGKYEN